jgi:hypothetical protein
MLAARHCCGHRTRSLPDAASPSSTTISASVSIHDRHTHSGACLRAAWRPRAKAAQPERKRPHATSVGFSDIDPLVPAGARSGDADDLGTQAPSTPAPDAHAVHACATVDELLDLVRLRGDGLSPFALGALAARLEALIHAELNSQQRTRLFKSDALSPVAALFEAAIPTVNEVGLINILALVVATRDSRPMQTTADAAAARLGARISTASATRVLYLRHLAQIMLVAAAIADMRRARGGISASGGENGAAKRDRSVAKPFRGSRATQRASR